MTDRMARNKKKTLYLVDGSGYIFRAYFAIRSLTTSDGFPTNALYGFTQMIVRLVEDEQPDYLAVVFDAPGPGFRSEIYPAYKANRPPKPEDLVPQLPVMREIISAYNIPALELEGFEADDVIATLATMADDEDVDTVIVSSDKDLMQLVHDECVLLDTMRNVRYDAAGVVAKMGVPPSQILDLLALMGDSSDNIPGVPGVGPKTAIALLTEFGSLDGVYANLESIKGKRRQTLADNRDKADLSRLLATLRTDVPLGLTLTDLVRREPDRKALSQLFGRLEFKAWQREYLDGPGDGDGDGDGTETQQTVAELNDPATHTVRTAADLAAMIAALEASDRIAVAVQTTDPHPIAARLVGLAFATDTRHAWYVPIGHGVAADAPQGSLFDAAPAPAQLPAAAVLDAIGPILGDPSRKKSVFDAKDALQVFRYAGIELAGVDFDPMLASYLLDAGRYQQNLANVAVTWLEHRVTTFGELAGSGKKQIRADQLSIDEMAPYACEEPRVVLALRDALEPRLAAEKLDGLLTDMELPLAAVLARMEETGVKIDSELMRRLSIELGARADTLERKAQEAAGRPFAVGSPKQLAEVLFDELGLPVTKRTKTGPSTDSSVLEELEEQHPLPALVLEWRRVSKLKSTYTDVLPTLVRPETGRIHTIFNQAVAATGRLSSEAPNLQNIPVRTEDGRKIREAFVPDAGCVLVSADYSQIELRILAHLAADERMQQGFRDGADIHRRTASEILGISQDDVTLMQRSMAKAINFGILYGMSAFRLAKEQGISRGEAQQYIDDYYARYPKIRAWKDGVLQRGRTSGYVSTMFGRIRGVGDLASRNGIARRAAERVAINTPVQGTAADIIKAAMVKIHARLGRELPAARLLLQVHDELVFEVPEGEAEALIALAKGEMSSVIQLDVPLEVNAAPGKNWLEAH